MKNNKSNVQGRFTLYLQAALKNSKGNYLLKKAKVKGNEVSVEEYEDVADYEAQDFLTQIEYATYKIFDGAMEMKLLLDQITDNRLIQALVGLSEQQKNIILLRIFYEKSFEDIGKIVNMPGKKAENTYFNTIKKIRKMLGGNRDVF